ncbi:o-succinylbenzoate synthase [Candidatus Sodalis pierantonius]|uniref:o-succinylbenzoate synthase n=1 Tax=Candidatus Sodalis pierantonii TaxID=1486991 RepID=UPI00046D1844|nr:o-succinylbenzoate synthase [Candidatus Sodalis pierantonius]
MRWTAGEASESTLDAAPPSVGFGISCALAAMPGARVAKLKVGLYEAIRDSLTVNMLLSALPDLRLRLDANRRWTCDRALQFARYLAPGCLSRIDFLEEPCGRPDDSLAFAEQTGIPIAWNESAREPGFTLHAVPGVAALVVKPSLTGALARCRQTLECAQEFGLTAVISSGVESSLALTQLSRLAQWLTPAVTPGLDTLSLMQAQLVRPWPGCDLPLLSWAQLEPIGTMP